MSHSITFNSVDLSSYGLTVVRSSLPGSPAAVENYRGLGQNDGGVSAPRIYDAREIVADVLIEGTSWANLCSNLDSIKYALNQREDVEIIFGRQADRYWLGRATLGELTHTSPLIVSGTITFSIADPFAYASSESTTTVGPIDYGVGGGTFTVTAAGTVHASPTIVFTASGSATTLVIEHDALDTRLVYTGGLAAGDKLRIQCDPTEWLVEKMPSGGDTYAEVMVDVDGQWPYLSVGANVFTVYDFEGSIVFTWRNRYV